MNLQITCPSLWNGAVAKARENRDSSLENCLMRVVNFAMPKSWQIEEAKKKYEASCEKIGRIEDFMRHFSKVRNQKFYNRAYDYYCECYDRHVQIRNEYYDIANGGFLKVTISGDFGDFYFNISNPDGSMYMNGGIVNHDTHWQIHT